MLDANLHHFQYWWSLYTTITIYIFCVFFLLIIFDHLICHYYHFIETFCDEIGTNVWSSRAWYGEQQWYNQINKHTTDTMIHLFHLFHWIELNCVIETTLYQHSIHSVGIHPPWASLETCAFYDTVVYFYIVEWILWITFYAFKLENQTDLYIWSIYCKDSQIWPQMVDSPFKNF